MSFIHKNRKAIASIVAFAFFTLVYSAAMPLQAAVNSETTVNKTDEDNPGVIEQAPTRSSSRGGSALPWIIGGVAVVAIALVLILVVFKSSFNIVGTWDLTMTGTSITGFTIIFSGSKESGNWELDYWTDTGTYTVDGTTVTFRFDGANWVFNGTSTDDNNMNGTHSWPDAGISGSWNAIRTSATAAKSKVGKKNGSLVQKLLGR